MDKDQTLILHVTNFCRQGPHLPNTGRVKAFAVVKNSSAYWLGNAENDRYLEVKYTLEGNCY